MTDGTEKAGKPASSFQWTEEANRAFDTLKSHLTQAPVLGYPNFGKPFVLKVDASLQGLGACLFQYDDQGQLHPIAYASRGLRGAEKHYPDYSSFKLEFFALKWGVADKFREYLQGNSVVVFTDNHLLAHIEQAKLGATEQCWVAQLAQFNLEIKYQSGKSNKCPDAQSHCPVNATSVDFVAVAGNSPSVTVLPVELGTQRPARKLSEVSNDL